MIAAGNPLLNLVCVGTFIYSLILFAWVVLSWVQLAGWRPPVTGLGRSAYELIEDVVRPVVARLRRIIPPAGPFDLSVAVAFVILFVIRQAVC
ncbi:MAG: YggT family protein [Actinobacteria bacterium]|nr:YggT family protein [Actinomycetota bacterium]